MGRVRKSHNFHVTGITQPNTTIWCFKCDNQKVNPGKKCQKCGAKCLIAPPTRYKNRLVEIRLIEAEKENSHPL